MKNLRSLLFAVGGSGGHFYPAVGLATALKKKDPSVSVFFAGGGVKNPKFFQGQSHTYHQLPCAPLSWRNPFKGFQNFLTLCNGFKKSCLLIDRLMPDLIVGFGSYYSVPLLLAAVWKRIPYVLHEQNIIPGRVIRLFSRKAVFTGIHFPETQCLLKGKSLHVGLPLRPDYVKGKVSQADARQYYLFAKDKPVALIFGGSQGSEGINQMVTTAFDKVSANLQVLHFTGNSKDTAKLKSYYKTLGLTCCVKDFEERMDLAWQAADWVISRSGAASLAEQVAFGVPGILIPYPLATDNHQEVNADHFVQKVKGGLKLLENRSDGKELAEAINQITLPEELSRYQKNIAAYQKRATTLDFVEEIMALIEKNK